MRALAVPFVVAAGLAHPGVASAGGHGSAPTPLGNLVNAAGATVKAVVAPPAAAAPAKAPAKPSVVDTLVGLVTQPVTATVAAATGPDASAAVSNTEQAVAGTVTVLVGGPLQDTVDQVAGELIPAVGSLARVTVELPVVAVGTLLDHPSFTGHRSNSDNNDDDGEASVAEAPAPATVKQGSHRQAVERSATAAVGRTPDKKTQAVDPAGVAPAAPPTSLRVASQAVIDPSLQSIAVEVRVPAARTKHVRRKAPPAAKPAADRSFTSLPLSLPEPRLSSHAASTQREQHVSALGRWDGGASAARGNDLANPRLPPNPAVGSISIAVPVPVLLRRAPTPLSVPIAQPPAPIPAPPG
jgi:hypothetical protein